MLIDEINKQILEARKAQNKDKLTFFSTFKGDVERKNSKSPSDKDVLEVAKAWKKALNENLARATNVEQREDVNREIEYLETILPTPVPLGELILVIEGLIHLEGCDNMGAIMKHLKQHYDGRYDGKIVSQLIKEKLNAR